MSADMNAGATFTETLSVMANDSVQPKYPSLYSKGRTLQHIHSAEEQETEKEESGFYMLQRKALPPVCVCVHIYSRLLPEGYTDTGDGGSWRG